MTIKQKFISYRIVITEKFTDTTTKCNILGYTILYHNVSQLHNNINIIILIHNKIPNTHYWAPQGYLNNKNIKNANMYIICHKITIDGKNNNTVIIFMLFGCIEEALNKSSSLLLHSPSTGEWTTP